MELARYSLPSFYIVVGGSSNIQTLSHDSSSIETEVYNNGKTHKHNNRPTVMTRMRSATPLSSRNRLTE